MQKISEGDLRTKAIYSNWLSSLGRETFQIELSWHFISWQIMHDHAFIVETGAQAWIVMDE